MKKMPKRGYSVLIGSVPVFAEVIPFEELFDLSNPFRLHRGPTFYRHLPGDFNPSANLPAAIFGLLIRPRRAHAGRGVRHMKSPAGSREILLFCPRCNAEYRSGFTQCTACG